MTHRHPSASIRLAGEDLTLWRFVASAIAAYAVSTVALLLGPLGALISMLIATATTAFVLFGLMRFLAQRPGVGSIVLAALAAIHVALLNVGVHAGLFWLIWTNDGLRWIESLGF